MTRRKINEKSISDGSAPSQASKLQNTDHTASLPPNEAPNPEDWVYRTLYESILDHRLAPGSKLKEVPLAEAFGVTRGVIRKALARLAAVKLVAMRSQHGATVASPSIEEVRQIFAARRLVESATIESLTGSISPRQVKTLREILKQERDSYRNGDMKSGIKLSVDFHVRLSECAGNSVLTEFLQQLVVRTPLIFLTHGDQGKNTSCSNHEHAQIIAAIIAGDQKLAVACMDEHLRHLESHVKSEVNDKRPDLASLLGLHLPDAKEGP